MTCTPFARLQYPDACDDRADLLTVGAGIPDQGAGHGPGDAVHALETGQPQAVEPAYRLAQVFGSSHVRLRRREPFETEEPVLDDQAGEAGIREKNVAALPDDKDGKVIFARP